jgi:hypothetical protein
MELEILTIAVLQLVETAEQVHQIHIQVQQLLMLAAEARGYLAEVARL